MLRLLRAVPVVAAGTPFLCSGLCAPEHTHAAAIVPMAAIVPTAAPVVDIVSEAVPPSALSMALSKLPLVAVLDQDLKHLLDRYNKTLTCTQFNRSQFALATARRYTPHLMTPPLPQLHLCHA